MLAALLNASSRVDRLVRAAAIIREECALRWLSTAEREALSNRIYKNHSRYFTSSPHTQSGLFDFEREVIDKYFPPPPARVLVGGSGSGRELLALLDLGFTIGAFYDPCEELLARSREHLRRSGASPLGWKGSHEQVARRTPGAPFDACILGWGSYTHVLGREARERLLANLLFSSPTAPVLLSFWVGDRDISGSRAAAFQDKVRALLQRLPGSAFPEPGDRYVAGTGFVHLFTQQELDEEAARAGYRVAHYQETGTYPHAVLVPSSDASTET